jgi:subtilisin family serine protease
VVGAEVIGTSRWQNSVLVRSADTLLLQRLGRLTCVSESHCVWIAPEKPGKPVNGDEDDIKWNLRRPFNEWDSVKNDPYGCANHQIDMLNGRLLHEAGFRGNGITIAILDGGFQNYDQIPALQQATIAGTRDFVPLLGQKTGNKDRDARAKLQDAQFRSIDHGTKVLSAIAAQAPEVIIGTAPEATFWLLRCEDPLTEQPVEEDFWTMAAEYADSVGADIINSSLGYNNYDGSLGSYRLQDLDGRTAFISRTASMLASKGMVLCNSAGNSGMGQWKKIGVPADADDIITVGAIDKEQRIAAFSSVGPSQDMRVKPDVVALGALYLRP